MLRKMVLLCIFLSCLGYTFAAPKPPDKECSSDSPTENAQPDKRDTLDSPLVVNARTIHSDKEAAEEDQKVAEQKHTNRWNIWLTAIIAVCAFLQVCAIVGQIVVYCGQSKLMAEGLRLGYQNAHAALIGARAAQLAARTSSIVQLPKLVIFNCEVFNQPFVSPSITLLRPPVDVTVHNYGQTPAFIVSWTIGIAYKNTSQEMVAESPLGKVIKPNTHEVFPRIRPNAPLNTLEDSSDMLSGDGWYTVSGIIVYDDVFGARETFEFCREITYRDGKIVISECGMSQANY
jgi:hypothetical protein